YQKVVLILNCRSDRIDRTRQFCEDFLLDVEFDTLICTGKSTQMVNEVMRDRPDKKYLNLEEKSIKEVECALYNESQNALLFCIDNIHGPAKKSAQYIEGIQSYDWFRVIFFIICTHCTKSNLC